LSRKFSHSNFNFRNGPRDTNMAEFMLRGEDPAEVRRRQFDPGDRYILETSHEQG